MSYLHGNRVVRGIGINVIATAILRWRIVPRRPLQLRRSVLCAVAIRGLRRGRGVGRHQRIPDRHDGLRFAVK